MNQYLAQYRQQMSRLRRIQREAEKRGYIFLKSPLPRAVKNPTAKTISRLSSITPTKLRSKGYKLSPETCELVRQTPRRQEAERKAQALARQQEHIRTALERYAKQREERRLAQWAKQHESEVKRLTEEQVQEPVPQKREYTTSEKLLRSNHPQEILDIYGVSDPAELPMKALERYAMLYDYDSKYEPENANVPEPPITHQEFKKISERKEEEERERERKEYKIPETFVKPREPMPYKDLVRLDIENLIHEIDYGRNPQVSDFLKRAIEDEITSLEMEYGEGQGAEIFAERLASTNEDLLNAARTTALSYDGGELQASSMKLLTVIRGTPSNAEKAELEKLVFEATDGVELSRKKRGYFRR